MLDMTFTYRPCAQPWHPRHRSWGLTYCSRTPFVTPAPESLVIESLRMDGFTSPAPVAAAAV
jgi:hypothetical protein